MALMYRYYFALGDEQKIVYAQSEVLAREKFMKMFGVEAGPLLSRDRW